jgi:hypothetical protein
MNRKRLEGFRRDNMDKQVFGEFARRKQLIKCSNGHYNQKGSKQCWKCGAWLSLGV